MASYTGDNVPKNDAGASSGADDAAMLERVQELTWAMIDEQISEDELHLLENLLLSDDGARNTYVDCVQLHTDLVMHFAEPMDTEHAARPPVLSFLGGATFEAMEDSSA